MTLDAEGRIVLPPGTPVTVLPPAPDEQAGAWLDARGYPIGGRLPLYSGNADDDYLAPPDLVRRAKWPRQVAA